jgi:hypothetical protein
MFHGTEGRPSFETRASKSAVADFDTMSAEVGKPDFGARSSG